jgi:hypothetical protein
MTDYTTMPDAEFWAMYTDVNAESGRRRTLETADAQQDALNESVKAAEGYEPGDPWVQPTGASNAYPSTAVVSHVGKAWESTTGGNVWEPGVSGWREVGSDWPDWIQPTGAHDAYPLGAQVTHNGTHWVSIHDGANTWEPGVYGWDPA